MARWSSTSSVGLTRLNAALFQTSPMGTSGSTDLVAGRGDFFSREIYRLLLDCWARALPLACRGPRMKLSGLLFISRAASLLLAATAWMHAADTSAHSKRNETFAPASVVKPADSDNGLATNSVTSPSSRPQSLQRVASSSAGEHTASLRVVETRSKPMLAPPAKSFGDRRSAREVSARSPVRYSSSDALKRLPLATKYQSRLSAGSVVQVGRTPVPRPSGSVSFNRFVFHRKGNAAISTVAAAQAATSAGGGRTVGEP